MDNVQLSKALEQNLYQLFSPVWNRPLKVASRESVTNTVALKFKLKNNTKQTYARVLERWTNSERV